nr:hypothetical protein [Neokomagataea thailandica]
MRKKESYWLTLARNLQADFTLRDTNIESTSLKVPSPQFLGFSDG